MEPVDFFTASRVIIVAGKGGVGKTTVACTLGVAATRLGLSTLLVEVEGKRGLASVFAGEQLSSADTVLIPADDTSGRAALAARTITADDALLDYLADHGLGGFARRLSRMEVLETLATSTPGLRDLIVLGKIKQLEREGAYDLILVDAPASGHAVSFLRCADALLDTVHTGPVFKQATDVAELLSDPDRCRVLLVTLPEETPVNELVETAYLLEDTVGVKLGPAVVNCCYPELGDVDPALVGPDLPDGVRAAAEFWSRRVELQRTQLARLQDELPLEQLLLPYLFDAPIDAADVELLADALVDSVRLLDATAVG
ncbi:MAG: hypothetical protein KDB21_12265 [Acidimicrobiales bacterium]|nr:hypothetical protein [Acidimicrobiales bacterium]